MVEIFISHAVADKELADKFVSFLKEAIGVPAKSIFCSSVDGQGIPLGVDFNDYMKDKIQNPKLVILLMTPRYMESQFCLMELGATWAKSHNALPIIVPPIKFNVVSNTLGLKQGWNITEHAKLVDLRDKIRSEIKDLEERIEHDWDKKRETWKTDLKELLVNLAPATKVSANEYAEVQDALSLMKHELVELQKAYAEANETIRQLKAAKDPVAVKEIMSRRDGFNAENRFNELMDKISTLRPQVSTSFYHNMIMDLFGKMIEIDFSDPDDKDAAKKAMQYSIIENEPPYAVLWNNTKLSKIKNTVKELQDFLESEEAAEFVKGQESQCHSMDIEDLEFWEHYLPN